MAGTAKPSVAGLKREAQYTVLGVTGASGSGGTVSSAGLFDGTQVNEWNTAKVMYWMAVDVHYIEIDIQSQFVNIWRSGTTGWKQYTGTLKIQKWNGTGYADVTSLYPQTATQITETQWEKNISNLPQGRYRFESPTASPSRLDSEWFIEVSSENKCLIFTNNEYKKYNGTSFVTVTTTTPTESDYINNGMNDIYIIPESAWQQLTGTVEFCYYTDDTAKTEAQFSIETNPFTLADEWANQTTINIIEYTDIPTQTESATTIETEPFSFYDEMGNSFDVLYYTDDTAKSSAILDITANYNPIDELVNPSLLLWTDAIQPITKTVNKIALPLPQTVKQSVDTFIDGDLVNFNLSVMENGDFAAVKTLLSGDSGLTWKTFKKGTWITVDINNQDDFIKKGMSAAEVNALTESTLALLGNKNNIRFAYYLKKRYVTDNASVQSLNASDRTFYPTPSVNNITINYDEIDKRFYALLFMDELNQVYSTSVGEILQYLDIGSLIAGQTSEEFKVLLNNGYNYAVNNIRLTAWNDLSGVSIEISQSNAPFIPASELAFNTTLSEGQSIEFYVRVSTERTAQATGIFSITAKADPIRP